MLGLTMCCEGQVVMCLIECVADAVIDSSLVDDGIQRSGSHSSDNSRGMGLGFSTSVPIDVPAWMGSSVNQATFNYHDDDDVNQLFFYLPNVTYTS